jgi:hypothetical protein
MATLMIIVEAVGWRTRDRMLGMPLVVWRGPGTCLLGVTMIRMGTLITAISIIALRLEIPGCVAIVPYAKPRIQSGKTKK